MATAPGPGRQRCYQEVTRARQNQAAREHEGENPT